MAKKRSRRKTGSVNKSEKIREYLKEHPGAGPTEVAKALDEFGVSVALVSNVKRQGPVQIGRRKKRKKGAATGARVTSPNGVVRRQSRQVPPIIAAAELIRVCGGVDEAKAALETAGQVASVLK